MKRIAALVLIGTLTFSVSGCAPSIPQGCDLTREEINENQDSILKLIDEGTTTQYAFAFIDPNIIIENPKCFDWRVLQLALEKQY